MQKHEFRFRGREVSRVEAFSDVVFGFALTLIVVSLEVPKSYNELMATMRGFWGFAICFAILIWVWHVHHTFFRRYALTDDITIALNAVLLFLVLFYTYPLKFIFALVTRQIPRTAIGPWLMPIYGIGFAGIFALFVAMYAHAWRKRDELELDEFERYDTKTNMIMYSSYVLLGIASSIVGSYKHLMPYAGMMYWLLGPVSAYIGWSRGTRRQRLQAAAAV
jgi:uncharacterized membrane protein